MYVLGYSCFLFASHMMCNQILTVSVGKCARLGLIIGLGDESLAICFVVTIGTSCFGVHSILFLILFGRKVLCLDFVGFHWQQSHHSCYEQLAKYC